MEVFVLDQKRELRQTLLQQRMLLAESHHELFDVQSSVPCRVGLASVCGASSETYGLSLHRLRGLRLVDSIVDATGHGERRTQIHGLPHTVCYGF